MLSVDGYTVWERIHESSFSEVYTGTRQSDGLRVVLKLYRGQRSESAGARAQREFELLQRIESDGVVRPVEVRAYGDRQVLIVERVPGYPLSRYAKNRKLTPLEVLTIGLGIARSLAAVHDARVIHKDLKLGNVLIDPERQRICVIDFGISSEFGRAERAAPPESAEGTMRYMAPEQTGRVGRGVDFRTDLYSLGVILYELLTGRPPFRNQDALELIYAHIAARPRAVAEVDANIPLTLSRIVSKLLEKDPQLRYQTARGLAADLEHCQKQLLATGEIDDDLALGSEDASDRLRFPSKLYGRERECTELCAAFDRIARGGMELVLLAGPAGIGKSSLPAVLQERFARTGGYLAEAKFDPDLRERPYAGFAAAFTAWVDQILTERNDRLATWREQIRASVGAIGQVLVELAPNLGYVVRDFPPLLALPAHEARERLALAVARFLRAVARPGHPLVLFLDDLQWADAGSLFLLGALMRAGDAGALLIIGGFRDNEVDADHPLAALLRELAPGRIPIGRLNLAPLRLQDTTSMLAEALGRTAQEAEWLARRVGPKSQHNPLLVRRLMFHLWDRNLIRYEHGRGWVWDEERLTEAEITDDAAVVLAARIDALPDGVRELIKLASLIGTVFELEVLVALSGADRLDVLQRLMSLVDQGLIAPCRDGFKFVHDRLREAAQSRLTNDERVAQHHRAAQLLLERTPPERLPTIAFQLAEHLCGALDRLSEAERPRAIEILQLAGNAALDKGAPDTAAHYLGFARSLLCEADWGSHFERTFSIYTRSVEAAFQMGELERALELIEVAEGRELDPLRQAVLIGQRISVYCVARPEEAIDLSLQSLRKFGIRWSRKPSTLRVWMDILRTDWLLRGPLDERTFSPEPGTDMSWLAPIVILRAAGAPLTHQSNRLTCLSSAYALRAFRRHWIVASPSLALASYAGFRIPVLRTLKGAQRYVEAAERWIERTPHPVTDARSQLSVRAIVHSWIRPRRKILEPLQQLANDALELGDVEYAVYALHDQVLYAALAGEPLEAVARRIEALRKHEGSVWMAPIYVSAHQRMNSLLREGAGAIDWDRECAAIDEVVRPLKALEMYIGVPWISTLCVFGEFERAALKAEQLQRSIFLLGAPGSRIGDYTMYRGLCRAVQAGKTRSFFERRAHLRALRSCLRQLRRWARFAPDLVHMAQLLHAESTSARGHASAAARLYQEAAQQARKAGHLHHAALCHERRAELLRRRRRDTEADGAVAAALELYEEWGARARVLQLKQGRGGDT
jgi:predicted ATPase